MKKTLYTYLFRETMTPFVLGLSVFTFALLMGRLLKLAEMVTGKGVPVSDVLLLIVYILPSFFLVTIPMAFLLAVLLGFGRLSSDGEITAMKASGISLYAMTPPLLLFAFIAYAATMFVTVYALPWGKTSFKKLRYEMLSTKAALLVRERVFNDEFPGVVIYFDRYDEEKGTVRGVMIQDERDKEEPATILAENGTITSDIRQRSIRLHLGNGTIHRPSPKGDYRLVHFGGYDLELKLDQGEGAKIDERDMSITDLRRQAAALPAGKAKRQMQLEYYRRFSLPFACFVFALVGLPLAMQQNRRSGKSAGFSLSIGILLIYYIVMSATGNMGEKGLLPPALAAWGANILLVIPGIWLFHRAAAEKPLPTAALFIKAAGNWLREKR